MSHDTVRERSDASLRVVGALAASVVIGIAGTILIAHRLCLHAPGEGRAAALGEAGHFQHGPEERTSIEEDWAKLDKVEGERLNGYAWADRKAGVVKIPIERAMERLAEEKGAKP